MRLRFSNGYPQFVQQIASSAYEFDDDDQISLDDMIGGMLGKGGAIDTLGTKHFQVPYFDLIKSDEYRAVLLVMAGTGDAYVSKDRRHPQGHEAEGDDAHERASAR